MQPTNNINGNSGRSLDVAINIFAKPFQTALTVLSLQKQSGHHISNFWLQFEPVGSKFDSIPPYHIAEYISDVAGVSCHVCQAGRWIKRAALTEAQMMEAENREGVRYQFAFEHSASDLLFVTHNDVFFVRDILGPMKENMGDAFAIGPIGQCWNCPASNARIMREVIGREACSPAAYADFKPDFSTLGALYKKARELNIFARPYDRENFSPEFEKMPWPLPECRVNEWACLMDLRRTRPHTIPFGSAWPPGAYRLCSGHNLDVFTPWFRDMHARGMHAKNFNIEPYMKHWVGTGNKSAIRYTQAEDNGRRILKKHFPEYTQWLEKKTGQKI